MLEGDELEGITQREDAPSWEDYQKQLDDLREKQQYLDRIVLHEQRLAEIRTEMENKNNPPSEKRLEEIKDELDKIHNDALPSQAKEQEYEVSELKFDTNEDLNFNL